MTRRHLLASGASFAAATSFSRGNPSSIEGPVGSPVFAPDLARLRLLAKTIPGPLPERINAVKVADSIRPRRVVIEGGEDTPQAMCRSLYQVVYPGGAIMLDTGMDAVTHRQFGAEGRPFTDPFYPEVYAQVLRALDESSGIFITHHHADHVGGLVRSPNRASLLAKSWITRKTAELMGASPHKPSVAIDPSELRSSILLDYEDFLPIAPGFVAIQAPAHSTDHQMVFVLLADGREFLLSIDSAWHMDHIRQLRLKAAPWVKEDRPRLLEHYRWLKRIDEEQKRLTVLVTHDHDQLVALTSDGTLGSSLTLRR